MLTAYLGWMLNAPAAAFAAVLLLWLDASGCQDWSFGSVGPSGPLKYGVGANLSF